MFLVDTNVMMAASAVHELSSVATLAMPREIELRELAFRWLADFDCSDQKILLDDEDLIVTEYQNHLPYAYPEQEYGMLMLQSKRDRNLVEFVPIDTDMTTGERIAVLDPSHVEFVPDRADRKWVACALAARDYLGENPPIVYAAERDWFKAEEDLRKIGIDFVRLLPDDWYTAARAER
jgi:hypothetical protein